MQHRLLGLAVRVKGGWSFLSQRRREPEWMDAPGADPVTLSDSLRFIRRINSVLRYTRSTIAHLEQFSRAWKPGETIRMIDFATGSGDIPLAVAAWGRQRGFDLHVVGIDLHETTCHAARDVTRLEPRVRIVRADALTPLPFEPGSFDYALSGLFLHHLSDDDAVAALKAMDGVSRRGIVIGDLLRDRRAYAWISLFTLFSNPMVKHDARVSVAQANSEAEARELLERSGLRYLRYARHFGHRFVLAGEK
jgi:2-polyprenyl-3-methyl-5-hydroxy-6-metoxy-1,4-benzoquinol methylase